MLTFCVNFKVDDKLGLDPCPVFLQMTLCITVNQLDIFDRCCKWRVSKKRECFFVCSVFALLDLCKSLLKHGTLERSDS